MNSGFAKRNHLFAVLFPAACLLSYVGFSAAQSPAAAKPNLPPSTSPVAVRTFTSPQQGGDALVKAAEDFDEDALAEIFGPEGRDIVFTGEVVQDKQHALNFANAAHQKMSVTVDPNTGNRAFLLVGNQDWPFPVPLIKSGQKWFFDSKAGRQELLYRRIGANEMDAIQVCQGYVEAQEQYALQPRDAYDVNQYAQRIISSPEKHDGLAWQNADGTWEGPIGEKIAKAIEQGYSVDLEPYHGYLFKILKGQGPAAPLGRMDYVIEGLMIGGFALVAAPAEYGVTGIQTFIVSQSGIVFEKDMGTKTIDTFRKVELFDPDKSWMPVTGQDQDETISETYPAKDAE